MIPREILKKIRQIEIRTNRIVTESFAGVLLQPAVQYCRIPRAVENRQDGKSIVFDGKVNVVFGEPAQPNLLRPATHLLKKFRVGLCSLQRNLHLQGKLASETRLFTFIPCNRLNQFSASRRFENERKSHFQPKRLLRSASTCSQGIPSCGFFSKSARRRSSSAACSGVKSGSYPSSTTMSQKSCASLILSACGSAFAALRISLALMPIIYRIGSFAQAGFSPSRITHHASLAP